MSNNESAGSQWDAFCRKGSISLRDQRASVARCIAADGSVRGYYSDLPLDPTVPDTGSLYPSHDHVVSRQDDTNMVVDARVINDMKTILSEDEFWRLVEHLYAVGLDKTKIPSGRPRRLPEEWFPDRNY